MPRFRAIRPVRIIPSLELDLDVHAGREVELHQRVHGLRGGIDDVEHALVRADFELLARLLVDVRRAVDGETLDERGQGDGSPDGGAGTLGRVDDLAGGMIQHAMVKGLEPDADVLTIHIARVFPSGSRARVPQPMSTTRWPARDGCKRTRKPAKTKWPARQTGGASTC